MLSSRLAAAVESVLAVSGRDWGPIKSSHRASGGCINEAAVLYFTRNRSAFVKWHSERPKTMFEAEARGLVDLSKASALHVPEVYGVGGGTGVPSFIVMEDLNRARNQSSNRSFDEELGYGLAEQHRCCSNTFGYDIDNTIGPTPQSNARMDSWPDFFRRRRLEPLLQLLQPPADQRRSFDPLMERLEELLEPGNSEGASLLHGDLWGGNVFTDGDGRPALIDPAVYYGHREADLAMTELFGGFGPRFREAYEESAPLLPGYSERRDIYNLYHLLNHALLFGGGYLRQAVSIAARYA